MLEAPSREVIEAFTAREAADRLVEKLVRRLALRLRNGVPVQRRTNIPSRTCHSKKLTWTGPLSSR